MFQLSFREAKTIVFACAFLAQSCAETPTTKIETPTVAVTGGEGAIAMDPPSYGPVAEPENLFGVFRVGSPISDLAVWRDLLPAHIPIAQLVSQGAPGLARIVYGSLGEYVDVGSPADIVVMDVDGDKEMVGSVVLRGVPALEAAAPEDFVIKARRDGSYSVTVRAESENTGLVGENKLHCAIFPGGEPVELHLVCAPTKKSLALGGPFIARNVSREKVSPGFHFNVPESAFRKMFTKRTNEKDAEAGDSKSKTAGSALGKKWLDDFSRDFSSVSASLAADPSGVKVGSKIVFRGATSPFSASLLGTPGAPTPALFWSIPKDADIAFVFPGATHETLKATLGTFWADMEAAFIEDEGEDLTNVPAFFAELKKLFMQGGPIAFAHGPSFASTQTSPRASLIKKAAAIPSANTSKEPDNIKNYRKARTILAGWGAIGMPEPSQKWVDGLREALRISNLPTRNGASRTTPPSQGAGGAPNAGTPKSATPSKKRPNGRGRNVTREVKVRPADALPPGTLHIVNTETPNPSYVVYQGGDAPLITTVIDHVFVAGTKDVTWIVFAEDETLAAEKLWQLLESGTNSIRDRQDLKMLQSAPNGAIGFATLRGFVSMWTDFNDAAELTQLKRAFGLPSGANTPFFISMETRRNEAGGTTLALSGDVSIAGALDLIQWFQ